MNRKCQNIKYIISDFFSAAIAWALFFIYRKSKEDGLLFDHFTIVFNDAKFFIGVFGIALCWNILYAMSGYYRQPYYKSRFTDFSQTFTSSAIGVIIIFFAFILDDVILDYKSYYYYIFILLGLHFIFTLFGRYFITRRTQVLIRARKIGFNTLLVGGGQQASTLFADIENAKHFSGNKIIGYIASGNDKILENEVGVPCLGQIEDIEKVIKDKKIDEVIIAVEPAEYHLLNKIISEMVTTDVTVKIIPDLDAITLGTAKTTSIFGSPLILLSNSFLPAWQAFVKRTFDILFSVFALVLLIPLWIYIIIKIRKTSPGPLFYGQFRVGLHGKPFKIYKFRSMYVDAESLGIPMLSSEDDPRITRFGKIMRKYRFDEFPQFINVLKGDMSVIGPRPERNYFIRQIVQKAPQYKLLLRVKPGITSWGEIKYGYAENVEQMVERMKFDLIYLDNISLINDIKILIYTILVIFRGEGK